MAFHFTCPQGHLLEADPSFAGQQCTCPHCGMLFIIPPPPAAAAPMARPQPGSAPQAGPMPQPMANLGPAIHHSPPVQAGPLPQPMPYAMPMPQPGPMLPPVPGPPMTHPAPAFAPPPATFGPPVGPPVGPVQPELPRVGPAFAPAAVETAPVATQPAEPEILHIPCPNGHELDTPREMLNQEVLCPHCGEQFLLRERNSVEFKQKKQAEMEAKDRKRGQFWLNWAIAIAVVVLLGLVILIFATSG